MNYSKQAMQSIINPDWNFDKMGIGGLDDQFSAIFRRAFASRVFPPEIVEQLGKMLLLIRSFKGHKNFTYSLFIEYDVARRVYRFESF